MEEKPADYEWQMSCPQNVLICGSSGTGKSTFVEKLISTPQLWEKPPDKIVYCYGIQSSTVNFLSQHRPEVMLIEGLPRNLSTPQEMFSPHQNNLLLVDDLSTETQNSRDFTNFMIRSSHHCNCCLVSIEHFLYGDSKERRLQSPHWHQYILFKNQRSLHQIRLLARQTSLDADKVEFAYSDATSNPYGYLVMDFRKDTVPEMRLLTNVMHEHGGPCYVYI